MTGRTEYAVSPLPWHSDTLGHFPIVLMALLVSFRLLPFLLILCLPIRFRLMSKLRPSIPISRSHLPWLVGVLPPRVARGVSLHHRGVSWTSFDPLKAETAGSHPGSLPPKKWGCPGRGTGVEDWGDPGHSDLETHTKRETKHGRGVGQTTCPRCGMVLQPQGQAGSFEIGTH